MTAPFSPASVPPRAEPDADRILRPAAWTGGAPDAGPAVAVLISGSRDLADSVRGYRTLLPRARIIVYGEDPQTVERAVEAGAEARSVPTEPRDALVRRIFTEVEADIYILAHGATADDVCVAPLAVAEVEGGRDLVDVRRLAGPQPRGGADRLLARAVDFAFGSWSDVLHSDFKVCSRRFAQSYRRTVQASDVGDASARNLALHALRLRLPVGRVTALSAPREESGHAPAAGWLEAARIAARLCVEERPRRAFGLAGLALVAAGFAVASPELRIHHWHATLLPGARTLAVSALLAAGTAAGAAAVVLDSLASARQEVRRLGAAAIPRRMDAVAALPAVDATTARRARSA